MKKGFERMMGYDIKKRIKKYNHLSYKFFERTAMFQMFAMMRLRNNKLLVPWGIIGAASSHGYNSTKIAQHVSTMFGFSTHYQTLVRFVQKYIEPLSFERSIKTSLFSQRFEMNNINDGNVIKKFTINMAIFDNSQKNFPHKNSFGGRSSTFIKLTSLIFIQLWIPMSVSDYYYPSDQCIPMTYISQKIISSPYMPMFDAIKRLEIHDYIRAILNPVSFRPYSPLGNVDMSGIRCKNYLMLLFLTTTMRSLFLYSSNDKEYKFCPDFSSSSQSCIKIKSELNTRRNRDGILHQSFLFQKRVAKCYRGQRPKAKILCLPLLPDDPTTKKGTVSVILKVLINGLLLIPNDDISYNMPYFITPPNIKEIYLLVVGDGLSQERWRFYSDNLLDIISQDSYNRHYLQCQQIKKALRQTVFIPGDLHLAWFHGLSPIYTFFYGGFLQPIIAALGIKNIRWNKIEMCYQKAMDIVLKVLSICEKRLLDFFFHSLSDSDIIAINPKGKDSSKDIFPLALSVKFEQYIDNKMVSTTDEWFKFVCNFVKIARYSRLMRESIRVGCSISIELIYNEFIVVWAAANKLKCTENVLSTMEELYNNKNSWMI